MVSSHTVYVSCLAEFLYTQLSPSELLPLPSVVSVQMAYSKVNTDDVEKVSDAMHFLREPLDCRQVGVTMARCEPNWKGKPHDHTADGHEEVYILIDGEATVRVDDEDVEMESGDAIWIPPDATRQIRNGDGESSFVLVSAPEDTSSSADETSMWIPDGVQG